MANNYLPSLAIITPCLNEEAIIEESLKKLLNTLNDLSEKNLIDLNSSKVLVVDDGSSDNSWNILKKLHSKESKVHCIKLSRNFGHQNALLSGILHSTEDLIITVDIDLQDDIVAMEKMIQEHSNGNEIVYGVKKEKFVHEKLKLEPISLYNKTKMCSERIILSFKNDMNIKIIRPATVCGYSPRMRFDLSVNALTSSAFFKKRITVHGGSQIRPNIHIEDLSDLYITSAATPDALANVKSGTYLGGSLFKAETKSVGKVEFETNFEF